MASTTNRTESESLRSAIRRASREGARVTVRHGKDRAVVVPETDAKLLEALEDALDVREVRRRRAERGRTGEKPVPLEEALKRLNL